MPVPSFASPFSPSLRTAVVLTVLMGVLLLAEGDAQRQVDGAYIQRYETRLLADELRLSSETLTRLVRTYVLTGDVNYKQNYLDTLSLRDGQSTALGDRGAMYWGGLPPWRLHLGAEKAGNGALLDRMRMSGFRDLELRHLDAAKVASDSLSRVELAAMALVSEGGPNLDARRQQARSMLFDDAYNQAKSGIMQSIGEAQMLLETRLQQRLDDVTERARLWRWALWGGGLLLLLAIWRVFLSFRSALGGTVDEVHAQITRIGRGEADDPIEVPAHLNDSVMGGLARTQSNLRVMNESKRESDACLRRLTRLYAALSLSRQSIFRCVDERSLFEQVCKIAVEHGGMRLAWVGLPDPQTLRVNPVAAYGAGVECLAHMDVSIDPAQPGGGLGPSGWVFQSDQPFWCQDFQSDPFMVRWREQSKQYGWEGEAALPVHRDGVIVGIFYVYAGEKQAFDGQTKRLLLEMASDFDVALRSLDRDTAQRASQEKDALGRFMLERLVSDAPLTDILTDFVVNLESKMPGALCSILLIDDKHCLRLGAAPNLPDFYNQAIDGTPIGPEVGSCGAAAATGQRIIVGDIANHPNWVNFKGIALEAGLASCWSQPILSGAKEVLGSFAIYHRQPVLPGPNDLDLIEMAANLCAIAIERKDTEVQLQLKARVFEQGNEAIVITDPLHQIVCVNHAFSRMTGYSEAEALGQNPRMLSSGRQDADFYRALWASLATDDHWQGEVWNRRKDGSEYPEWLSISVLRDRVGEVINYVGIATDITQRKEDEGQIKQLVNFDSLTGLPNRRLLQDRVKTALSHAQRANQPLALMFVDLDRFKNVNDSLGHHVGDELLIQVARRLDSVLRDQDTVCRLGGDEFVLLCPDTDAAGAAHVAEKLLESVARRFLLAEQELAVTFSIGVAMYPCDGDSFEALSMRADAAMYRAKHAGRNAYRFFTVEMQTESNRTLQLENALSRALELQQLHLVYQPQIALDSGQIVGVEALLRWQHPTLGLVSPAEFIPVAEDSGLILPIGEWVLRTAVAQLQCWQAMGLDVPLMAVNLSVVQFRQANLPDLVTRVLQEAGVAPECLELELTEGVAMDDPVGAIAVMTRLRQRGVRMSIDDFGTGYSSLSYLKRFSAYKLKIDQSFVRDIAVDPDDKAIVVAIIALARSLGFRSIAEGVETPGQLAFLREQGCDEVQGYLYSRPLTAANFEAYYRDKQAVETLDS
jgi:diguanylate cyclase (GGDEF)-like protein/PAS domain S-box-containing protein